MEIQKHNIQEQFKKQQHLRRLLKFTEPMATLQRDSDNYSS